MKLTHLHVKAVAFLLGLGLGTSAFYARAQGDDIVSLCVNHVTMRVPFYLINRYLAIPGTTIGECTEPIESGVVSTRLATPLTVTYRGAPGQPLAGHTISWAIDTGGGDGELEVTTSVTDAQGIATNLLTLGDLPALNKVTATAAGTGEQTLFQYTGDWGPQDMVPPLYVEDFRVAPTDGSEEAANLANVKTIQNALFAGRIQAQTRAGTSRPRVKLIFGASRTYQLGTSSAPGESSNVHLRMYNNGLVGDARMWLSLIGNHATLRCRSVGSFLLYLNGRWGGSADAPVFIHNLNFESDHTLDADGVAGPTIGLFLNDELGVGETSHWEVSRNTFHNFSRGIFTFGVSNLTIRRNRFIMDQGHKSGTGANADPNVGIWFGNHGYSLTADPNGPYRYTRDVSILENEYDGWKSDTVLPESGVDSAGDGLVFGSTLGLQVRKNRIKNFSFEGIYILPATYPRVPLNENLPEVEPAVPLEAIAVNVEDNVLDGGKGHGGWGIRNDHDGTTIARNTVTNISGQGILVDPGSGTGTVIPNVRNVAIRDNVIDMVLGHGNHGMEGIRIAAVAGGAVTGNSITFRTPLFGHVLGIDCRGVDEGARISRALTITGNTIAIRDRAGNVVSPSGPGTNCYSSMGMFFQNIDITRQIVGGQTVYPLVLSGNILYPMTWGMDFYCGFLFNVDGNVVTRDSILVNNLLIQNTFHNGADGWVWLPTPAGFPSPIQEGRVLEYIAPIEANDPLPRLPDVLHHPGPAGSGSFGAAVAISGTRTVVGAPWDGTGAPAAGMAFVYDLCEKMPMILKAALANPGAADSGTFGRSVAISGTRVVVGAPDGDDGVGATYVYDLSSATPTVPVLTLTNPSPAAGDSFGNSVAISGTRILVGAPGDDAGATDAGRIYVYEMTSATPTLPVATLNNPTPAAGDNFGNAVAIDGTRAVVGASGDDTGATDAGSAYVYDLSSVTPPVPVIALNNPTPAVGDHFGNSVAISGTRVVVGAALDDTGATDAGSACVYNIAGTMPTVPVVTLNNPSPAAGDHFGRSVAISSAHVVVGAPDNDTGAVDAGSTYIYDLGSVTPTVPLATHPNPTPSLQDAFGTSVAIDGITAIVGTPNDDSIPTRKGSTYIFNPNRNDQDSDGLLDSWEQTYWPSTSGHSLLDDSDGDGYVELVEQAFGLNPTLPNPGGLPPLTVENGYLTMKLNKHPGVTYEIQSAGTLLPDSFSKNTTTILVNNDTTLKVRDNVPIGAGPARYLRVKVTAAP